MYVCMYVCMYALTAAHLWGHSYEYTPAKWGLFKLWGHFRVPAKKVLLNLFFWVLNHITGVI